MQTASFRQTFIKRLGDLEDILGFGSEVTVGFGGVLLWSGSMVRIFSLVPNVLALPLLLLLLQDSHSFVKER